MSNSDRDAQTRRFVVALARAMREKAEEHEWCEEYDNWVSKMADECPAHLRPMWAEAARVKQVTGTATVKMYVAIDQPGEIAEEDFEAEGRAMITVTVDFDGLRVANGETPEEAINNWLEEKLGDLTATVDGMASDPELDWRRN